VCVVPLSPFVERLAAPAAAQTVTDERVWTTVSMQGRLEDDSPWRWASDSMVRSRDGASALDALLQRLILTRDVGRRSSVDSGTFCGAGFPERGTLHEHALVQQYAWSGNGKRRVALKSRLEERFITGKDHVVVRARQLARVTWPRGALRGVVSEELFLQLNATARMSAGFEQSRAFFGLARQLTPRSAIEIGYPNVYARTGANRRQLNHVVSTALAVAF